MKKTLFAVLGLSVLFINTGCRRSLQNYVNDLSYKNPKIIGGLWTVKQGDSEIKHLECIYWSTNDDDAIFRNPENGKVIFVNGSSLIFEE